MAEVDDGFLSWMDEGGEENQVVEAETIEKKTRTFRADKVIDSFLRFLTKKRKLTEEDLEAVYRITVQKIIEAVQAQAITIYTVGDDNNIGFSQVFFSESLHKTPADKKKYKENRKIVMVCRCARTAKGKRIWAWRILRPRAESG